MRIAIVNDLVIAIEALRRVLITVPEHQIAWVAKDGAEAVSKCAHDTPDLILMDLLMPVMDGVEATRQIMKKSPCAILIVTADIGQNAAKVFEAMGAGALDAVNTPVLGSQGSPDAAQALLAKITTIGKLIGKSRTNASKATTRTERIQTPTTVPPLVAIGSSTGGPKALAAVLSQLPATFGAAIAIVQHVDQQFASGLADWLNQQTPLPVKIAAAGDRLERGKVLVAGTNDHLILKPDLSLGYIREPADYPYRPSVDVFFKSLAQHWSRKDIAVLLTGMGRDGAEGLSTLRFRGWHTIAQDADSCVVYGMPKAAAELNAAIEILNPDTIAKTLVQRVGSR